jgi:hypothetical protein
MVAIRPLGWVTRHHPVCVTGAHRAEHDAADATAAGC